ncbi:unnamed protein product [Schistosoma rodhaini]|uniref:Uncharacterized protein n=1 Tax=Schistosoma rodhaini TaxID=6188 RepID=A0AA85GFP7_9TREM|nr:unnamed protein product [Schistosoma rodhaini]
MLLITLFMISFCIVNCKPLNNIKHHLIVDDEYNGNNVDVEQIYLTDPPTSEAYHDITESTTTSQY